MNKLNLDRIGIEISSQCNYRCVGCPHSELTRGHGNMDTKLFLDIFKEIGNNTHVIFLWNYGDPLLNPHIVEMLEGIKNYRCKKILSTTGWKLNDFQNLKFLTNLDELIISINGLTQNIYELHQKNGNLKKVVEGVKRLAPVLKRGKTKLILQMVAHNKNLEQIKNAALINKFALKLGFHEIAIKSFNVMDGKQKTFDTFVPVGTPYSRYSSNFKGKQYPNLKKIYPCTKGFVINWDGSITTCCWDYKGKYILGDAKKNGIQAIWNSPRAIEHRNKVSSGKFLDICTGDCSVRNTIMKWSIKN